MSLQAIKEIIKHMETQQRESIVTRRDFEAVKFKIKRIRERLPKSVPNWIGQDIDAIIKFVEDAVSQPTDEERS